MFILVFVVSFGPKKGTIIVYSDSWYLGFYRMPIPSTGCGVRSLRPSRRSVDEAALRPR
jgi:hypothetical protein